jgi:hypothetical protein
MQSNLTAVMEVFSKLTNKKTLFKEKYHNVTYKDIYK